MTKATVSSLLDQMPDVRGTLTPDAPLARHCWFRTGGPADILFEPLDEDDLSAFLAALPLDIPVTVIGVGSNLLVRDGGVEGVVIRLGKGFADIQVEDDKILAGAGAMDVHVARAAEKAGLAGFAWLVGVPGTLGGALRMNAGAYESDLSDILISARAVDRSGAVHTVQAKDLRFNYRRCGAPSDWIFLSGEMQSTERDSVDAIGAQMKAIMATRQDSQPIGSQTGGSTFKNPPQRKSQGKKAWELIDDAGCRGLTVGDAMMSDKHCNFMINKGAATASDVEALGEMVRERVKAATGVALEWEIRRIGRRPSP